MNRYYMLILKIKLLPTRYKINCYYKPNYKNSSGFSIRFAFANLGT